MQSKTSLINKEIIKSIFRSVGWVSILYFLCLIFILPLNMFILFSNGQGQFYYYDNLFSYNFFYQAALMIGIPVILSMFLFRFLQVKQYSDFIHSLPIKRTSIFHQYTLLGYFILITPIVLIAGVILLLYSPLELNGYFPLTDIFEWLGLTILFNTVFYIAGVAVAMISGISIVQGVLTYIALLLPLGLLILISYNLQYFLFGFSAEYILQNKLDFISPLVVAAQINYYSLSTIQLVLYIGLIIVLYFTALFLYKKRNVESVSHALVFPILKPFFKYGVTFCMMLLGGLYFGEMQGDRTWVMIGYIFGAILGYLIAEMVLQKSWRITVHLKGFILYCAAIICLVVLLKMDLMFFEKKMPAMNEIESVHFSEGYYGYYLEEDQEQYSLKERDNIHFVQQLHKSILNNHEGKRLDSRLGDSAFFAYKLKNGKKVVREYKIDKKNYEGMYKLIFESEEYKIATNDIFSINENEVSKIMIHSNSIVDKITSINKHEEKLEFIKALKQDILTSKYEDMQEMTNPYASINIITDKDDIYLDWNYYNKEVEAWLNNHGYSDVRLTGDDLDYALIVKKDAVEINDRQSYEEIRDTIEKSPNKLKIEKTSDLEETLVKTRPFVDGDYVIVYYYKDINQVEISGISAKDAPEFIKNNLK